MGRRNGESGERNSGADSFCRGRGGVVGAAGARGGGGGGGTQSGFRRKKTAGLTLQKHVKYSIYWIIISICIQFVQNIVTKTRMID
jgi:hypothetical protein